jgi:hypothetical protein
VQYIYEIAKIKKEMDPDLKKVELPQIMNVSFIIKKDDCESVVFVWIVIEYVIYQA